MKYFVMTVSILLSVLNACLLKSYTNGQKKTYSTLLFNSGVCAMWVTLLSGLLAISVNEVNLTTVGFGIVYGVILFAFLFFKTSTMQTGPITLGTLVGSCAFLITIIYGVGFCDESINIEQISGILLLIISLVFCINPKKSTEILTGKWLFNCTCFFLAGGAVGILYKIFGASPVKDNADAMLCTAAIVGFLLFLISNIIFSAKNKCNIKPCKRTVVYMILSGIASCIYIRLNISLSAIIPSVVFFPVSNGGMVILSALCGKLVYGEKLNRRQSAGIILGCVAILIIGCAQ